MSQHLWEIDHPYYCNLGNYYQNGCFTKYEEWADFIEEQGNDDLNLNLVFRFDWTEDTGGEDGEPLVYDGNPDNRNATLYLFYMNQRKGAYRWVEVSVCRNDEPVVIEWLTPRWLHMKQLWEPFA